MDNKPKTGARDFFLHLAGMATLYVSAVSLITLIFQYINYAFPSNLDYYYDPFSGAIRFSIAALIVIFPLYLFFTRKINQEERLSPERKELWVRKWLVYLTLFVGGVTLVVDLIVLINEFLGGELSTRFSLKVLTVLIVIGAGFVYYLLNLRGYWESREKLSKNLGIITALVVLVSIVSGFFIIGSPFTQRQIRLDSERVSDLQTIQWQIVNYWQQKGILPNELADLEDPISGFTAPTDPETGEAYVYNKTTNLGFELCANFNQSSIGQAERLGSPDRSFESVPFKGDNWDHEAGEVCFDREIDPELYPVRK